MNISIGVMAYNEEANIGNLLKGLLSQKTKSLHISEIIVVSSGSTDKTDQIVKSFTDARIKLITEKKRLGKWRAINQFLAAAKEDICVMQSADTIPKEDTIERLCAPLKDPKVGIVGGRPVPVNKGSMMAEVVQLQWQLHHEIAKERPKFGEIIAFRKLFRKIPPTAVDEEQIAMMIQKLGYKGAYAEDAIVYNKGPETVRELIMQRRRINCGHRQLMEDSGYLAPSYKLSTICNSLMVIKKKRFLPSIILGCFVEGLSRIISSVDIIDENKNTVWKISSTTKNPCQLLKKHI